MGKCRVGPLGLTATIMLEQLFSSKTRVKLLNLFLRNPDTSYYVRELARNLGEFLNSIRRELSNLEKFGLLKSTNLNKKKFYQLNSEFFLHSEIKSLFLKAEVFLENNLVNRVRELGPVDYLVFTGFFTGVKAETDLLIISNKVDKVKLEKLLKDFTQNIGKPVRYTVMPVDEFLYRKEITDTFIYDILLKKKLVVIDNLGVE